MAHAPIFDYIAPQNGEDKDVYSPDQFDTVTGTQIIGTPPIRFSIVSAGKLPYFAGAQVIGNAPAILVQPFSISVETDSIASFTVQATSPGGSTETQYAWYRNGIAYTSNVTTQYATPDSTYSTVVFLTS